MQSLWKDSEARKFKDDPLALRVYTSRLLGREDDLVLHGGGNTSVKISQKNIFGETESILSIKGSGWDLATIEKAGFAPVKMKTLLKMAEWGRLADSEMVRIQRSAMTDPNAPNPSVEAILHAIIPYRYVDHTHADAVVAVSNTPNGRKRIEEIYGPRALIVPYVMPGFILARKVYLMTRRIDWEKIDTIILMNHGIFTFADSAKESYENMIREVTKAEKYLAKKGALAKHSSAKAPESLAALAKIRQTVSFSRGGAVIAQWHNDNLAVSFANRPRISSIAARGPLTPDHVIRTKRIPVIIQDDPVKNVARYARAYMKYFEDFRANGVTCLDSAPRWAVWPKYGVVAFGRSVKENKIISDIVSHTMKAVLSAEKLGGWKALPAKDIFDVEYWELEQAKLKQSPKPLALQGKVAVVTGAASGIGRACVEELNAKGACVVALDINPGVAKIFKSREILGIPCDVTDTSAIRRAVEETIRRFGGLDILVSNAGIFPASEDIAHLELKTWNDSLSVNLTSHQILLKACIPYLSLGIDPAVIIVASKNVPAPGPGVSAYSVAKAGLTQFARVAALELAEKGIRVNVVHPNQVFDTALWTKDILQKRAKHYRMSVEEYKRSNLLKVTITSKDVAGLVCTMAGPSFLKTTGAQVPIDGGNDRVI